MKITYKSNPDITKRDLYLMTRDAEIKSMKDVANGETIKVKQYIYFDDENNKGEVTHVLTIMGDNGDVWSTTSKTFMRSFDEISELMEDEEFEIRKKEGVSKAGRPYVDCSLV